MKGKRLESGGNSRSRMNYNNLQNLSNTSELLGSDDNRIYLSNNYKTYTHSNKYKKSTITSKFRRKFPQLIQKLDMEGIEKAAYGPQIHLFSPSKHRGESPNMGREESKRDEFAEEENELYKIVISSPSKVTKNKKWVSEDLKNPWDNNSLLANNCVSTNTSANQPQSRANLSTKSKSFHQNFSHQFKQQFKNKTGNYVSDHKINHKKNTGNDTPLTRYLETSKRIAKKYEDMFQRLLLEEAMHIRHKTHMNSNIYAPGYIIINSFIQDPLCTVEEITEIENYYLHTNNLLKEQKLIEENTALENYKNEFDSQLFSIDQPIIIE